MEVTNATQAIEFVITNGRGAPEASKAQLADSVGRAIGSRYEYLKTWGAGRALSLEAEYDVHQAIGVLRLEYFRLTGRAWLGA